MNGSDEEKCDSPAPRRSFLKQGLISIAGFAAMGSAQAEALQVEGTENSFPRLATPLKVERIIRNEATGEAPRQQYYMETEMIGSNDVKHILKSYLKRVDLGTTYDSVTLNVTDFYSNSSHHKPIMTASVTVSISGVKGKVEGDYRLDTITTTISSPLGITTEGPKQVKVLMKDPTVGMSDQEKLDFMIKFKGGV